jgi:hypothetical protein
MRRYFFLLALPLALWAAEKADPQTGGTLSSPLILSPDSVATVNARMGMLTSVTLLTDKPVQSMMKGGPEINLMLDGNVVHIQPLVPEGLSSLTFRVDSVTYVIRVRITPEDPTIPNPVFTFAKQGKFDELDRAVTAAPALKPSDIDINGAIRVIERAATDRDFRATLQNFQSLPIRKIYAWNHNEIHLLEAHQFADLDLIVFKISWVNQQGTAFYLHQNQYRLFIGEKQVMTQARRQLAPRAIVFPGQQETVWLAVQGYKLRLDNDWNLRLPPEASELRAYTRSH